ncbi:hypothetical protein [Fusobacterium sp. MFO224]|uniref:hypothetical protein n=1 Tax=Fusobacterium sp. MFO224 TaxID=3378070 RepID=UPI003852BA1C
MEKEYNYLKEIKTQDSLIEIFKILFKRKFLVISVFLIISALSVFVGKINYSRGKRVVTAIGYNYDGISKGLNPDGTRFSVAEIKNNIIARKVYEKYPILKEKGIGLTEFIYDIKINGIIPKSISVLAENSLRNGEKFLYNPIEYKISLKLTGDSELDSKILTDLTDEYLRYFKYKYEKNEIFSTLTMDDLSGYDYIDKLKILNLNIDMILKMASRLSSKNFVSKRTGLSYGEIEKVFNNLKEVDLKNLNSSIETSNLTNNIFDRKLILENKIRGLKIDKEKASGKADILKEMLRDYKPSNKKVMLSNIQETGLEVSTEGEYYSKLLKTYQEVAAQVNSLEIDINELNDKILKLNNDEELEIKITKKIEKVIKKYNDTVVKMNLMNQEYYDKYFADSVKIIFPVTVESKSKARMIIFVGIIAGIMIGLASAFVAEFIENCKKAIK